MMALAALTQLFSAKGVNLWFTVKLPKTTIDLVPDVSHSDGASPKYYADAFFARPEL
jgi:hypothetical protein